MRSLSLILTACPLAASSVLFKIYRLGAADLIALVDNYIDREKNDLKDLKAIEKYEGMSDPSPYQALKD